MPTSSASRKPSAPAPTCRSAPVTPEASIDAAPDQPETINPNHNQNPSGERTTTMQNGNTNGHEEHTAAETSPIGEKPSLEQALDQIEFVKGSLRGAVTNLNNSGRHVASGAARTPPQRAGNPLRARHPQGVADCAPVVSSTTHPNEPKGRMPPQGACPALRRSSTSRKPKTRKEDRESMSHNLMIQNGEASMMYVGGVPLAWPRHRPRQTRHGRRSHPGRPAWTGR